MTKRLTITSYKQSGKFNWAREFHEEGLQKIEVWETNELIDYIESELHIARPYIFRFEELRTIFNVSVSLNERLVI